MVPVPARVGQAGMALGSVLLGLEQKALDLFFPRRCVGCSSDGDWLCAPCQASVKAGPGKRELAGHPVISLLPFERPEVRELLHGLKYDGIADAAGSLADASLLCAGSPEGMFGYLDPEGRGIVLVPVPSAAATRRRRGYSQAVLLAEALGVRLGLPVWPQALVRTSAGSQVGHTAAERKERASTLFSWGGRKVPAEYGGRVWVVVDDLLTTGATVDACLGCLEGRGAGGLAGLAVAWER